MAPYFMDILCDMALNGAWNWRYNEINSSSTTFVHLRLYGAVICPCSLRISSTFLTKHTSLKCWQSKKTKTVYATISNPRKNIVKDFPNPSPTLLHLFLLLWCSGEWSFFFYHFCLPLLFVTDAWKCIFSDGYVFSAITYHISFSTPRRRNTALSFQAIYVSNLERNEWAIV